MASLRLQNFIIERMPNNDIYVSHFNGKDKIFVGKSNEVMCINELENGELVFIKKSLKQEGIIHYYGNKSYTFFASDKINKILPNIYLLTNNEDNKHLLYNTKSKCSLETFDDQIIVRDENILSYKNIVVGNYSDTIVRFIAKDNLKYTVNISTLQQRIISNPSTYYNSLEEEGLLKLEVYNYLLKLNEIGKIETREENKREQMVEKILKKRG